MGGQVDLGAQTLTERHGDTIITRTVGEDQTPRFRLVPDQRIGELDGPAEYTFGRVDAVVPDDSGGVYVWDGLAHLLRHFDSRGHFLRQVGRRGRGPGEYEDIAGMTVIDGRLVFWDKLTQHVNIYDRAGALQLSQSPPYPQPSVGELYLGTDGRYFLRHILSESGGVNGGPHVLGYVGYRGLGHPTGDTIVQPGSVVNATTRQLQAVGHGDFAVQRVPFSPTELFTVSPKGCAVSGVSDRYALLVRCAQAPPLVIERDVAPVTVTDGERADAEARVAQVMRRVDPGWTWTGPAMPSVKPFFRRVRFDDAGRFWVERALQSVRVEPAETPPEAPGGQASLAPARWREPVMYDLFETDGTYRGSVDLPDSARFLFMRADTVWGAALDSLDVSYVMRWHLERVHGTPDGQSR